ncbi:MAG TPA: SIS domain-containing protein [Peptococcaceae bacterium]|nr:SIS domain-containing protein [Peptococcaceae bacterium]
MSKVFETVKQVLYKESKAIMDAFESIDKAAIEKLVEIISQCKGKILLSGCGTSGAAARKIAHTLSCVERPAFFLEPADALHGGLGAVDSDDVVVLLSKGGASLEINSLIKPLKTKKAFIIGVTENEESVLAKESDLFIKIKVKEEADHTGLLATSSIIGVIAVFDAVAIASAEITGFTREKFSVIHPGGAVGQILLKKNQIN